MNTKIVTVTAAFEARPGKETELRQALLGLVTPTRKESGCLNYDLHALTQNPAKFLFHENWTSKDLLEAHLRSAHIQALLPQVSELCVSPPDIQLWEKIS